MAHKKKNTYSRPKPKPAPPKAHPTYHAVTVLDGAHTVRVPQVAKALLVAALAMLVLGSKSLLSWANDLPIGTISDQLLFLAQTWHDWMEAVHLTWFGDKVAEVLHWLQAQRF